MNRLEYWQSLFYEFGWKVRFLRFDIELVDATVLRLRLQKSYNINNLVISLSKQGVLEVLEFDDEVALKCVPTYKIGGITGIYE